MTPPYEPPFIMTPRVLDWVVRFSEEIGRQGWSREAFLTPICGGATGYGASRRR